MKDLLKVLLEQRMEREKLSSRAAAEQIGVAHTTVIRALRGESVDIDTLMKICDWLGVSMATIMGAEGEGDEALSARIAAVIQAYPQLEPVFAEAMDRFEKREVSAETIADLVNYINYRLNIST